MKFVSFNWKRIKYKLIILVVSDVHEASICYLNFARLMLLYVKDFELSNVNYALNYAFFLRNFELDPMTESRGRKRNSKK